MKQIIKSYGLPFLTFTLLLVIHLLQFRYNVSYTLTPMLAIVVLTICTSGKLQGLVSSSMVAGYAIYSISDPIKMLLVVFSLVIIVLPVIVTEQNHDIEKTVASLLYKIREIHSILLGVLISWADLNDEEKWTITENVHVKISELLTASRGWHLLAQEKKAIETAVKTAKENNSVKN